MDNVELHVIRNRRQLDALERPWRRLYDHVQPAGIFTTYDWIAQFLDSYGDREDELRVFAGYCDGSLVGIMPLRSSKVKPCVGVSIRETSFICNARTDYQDAVCHPAYRREFLRAACVELMDRRDDWNVIRLSLLRGDSEILPTLVEEASERGLDYVLQDQTKCYYVNMRNEHECMRLQQQIGSVRDTRKRLRMLGKLGEVRYERIVGAEEISSRIGQFFEMHRKRWCADGNATQYDDQNNVEFMQSLLNRLPNNHQFIEMLGLTVGDKMVASHIHFNYQGRYYHYNCAYDPDFEKMSPGKILNWFLIRDLIEGYDTDVLDFLRGEETYKRYWTDTYVPLKGISIYNPKPSSYRMAQKTVRAFRRVRAMARMGRHVLCVYERSLVSDAGMQGPDCPSGVKYHCSFGTDSDAEEIAIRYWSQGKPERIQHYRGRGYRCIVATDVDGNVLGYGWFATGAVRIGEIKEDLQLKCDECALLDFYVAPECRGKGIYTNLLRAGLEEARGKGYQMAYIWCRKGNLPSKAAIEHSGFQLQREVGFIAQYDL